MIQMGQGNFTNLPKVQETLRRRIADLEDAVSRMAEEESRREQPVGLNNGFNGEGADYGFQITHEIREEVRSSLAEP